MALPQEIWWLVSQEFTARRDFLSLFSLAQVNRSMANMALPLLYRCVLPALLYGPVTCF